MVYEKNGEGRVEEGEGERESVKEGKDGGEKGWGEKKVRRERKGSGRVREGKSRGWEGGEGLCSSKNSFKKPWSWTLANFETDRRP